jgi:hypothetical protein
MQIFVKTLTGKYYAAVGDVKRASLVVIDLVVPNCPHGTQRRFGCGCSVVNSLFIHARYDFSPELQARPSH